MKTIRMKQADWKQWDEALRSGRYDQAREYLFDGSGYCCLGVLQHCLTGRVESNAEELPSLDWLDKQGITFDSRGASTQEEDARVPALKLDGHVQPASVLNDDGVDFVRLADAIQTAVEFTDA